MAKNILVISTSLRNNSNSELMADYFIKGVKETTNFVEKITLKDKKIAFCKGCLSCQKTKKCIIDDDAIQITEKMCNADVIVFATPIYYYEMSGQMKTLLDRANSLYVRDHKFKEIYLLTSAAEDNINAPKKAISGLEGWIDCFEKAKLIKTLFAGGVTNPGDINDNNILNQAYELGKNI